MWNASPHDPQLEAYFGTLPAFVQESIKQTSVSFRSVDEMKRFVNGLTEKNG